MSRRRRQKNTLLPKVFGIAVLVNCVAVLIAAQFGAFKAIQREFGPSKVVLVTPADAPKEKEKPAKKKENKSSTTHKAAGSAKSAKANRPKANAPAVVTAGPSNGEGTGGPVADQGTGLKPGEIPTNIAKPGGAAKPDTTGEGEPKPATKPEPPPEVKPETKPQPKATPAPEPAKFIDCVPTEQPQPTIPDDLLSDSLSKDFIAEVHVGPDGVPTSASVFQSTGISELDKVALEAAKRWRFTPATLGGQATDQTVHVKMQFRVQ
jgi:protein TonB